MLEVFAVPEGAVEVQHARGEVLREPVDGAGCHGRAGDGGGVAGIVLRGDKALREMVEDGDETVVFVETRESAGGELTNPISKTIFSGNTV